MPSAAPTAPTAATASAAPFASTEATALAAATAPAAPAAPAKMCGTFATRHDRYTGRQRAGRQQHMPADGAARKLCASMFKLGLGLGEAEAEA